MQLVRYMTRWFLLAGLAAPAFAACGHAPVIDWGLHRQWRVECDAAHPERPARLIEVPWSEPEQTDQHHATTASGTAQRPPILIHRATRVEVRAGSGESVMRLSGTALEAGAMGAAIRVRAGWNGAALPCVVRGPGVVELLPERGRY